VRSNAVATAVPAAGEGVVPPMATVPSRAMLAVATIYYAPEKDTMDESRRAEMCRNSFGPNSGAARLTVS